MKLIITLLTFFELLAANNCRTQDAKKWALLMATSSGWKNYADQADLCHAYHIVTAHGVPADNIVVMMFDDVASDERNPFPGKLFNRLNGTDVYAGVPLDYRGDGVNALNFIWVLSGKPAALRKVGSGRSIQSKQNDTVFVYITGVGTEGALVFPDQSVLDARDLNTVLQRMSELKQFGKILFYVDTPYSGSMFKRLLYPNMKMYAVTSSDYDIPSYRCQYHEKLGTYVNNQFSYFWKYDSETVSFVEQMCTNCTVMEWGQLDLHNLTISEFLGRNPVAPVPYHQVGCFNGTL